MPDMSCEARLRISTQYFHHHAAAVRDRNPTLEDLVRDSVEQVHSLACSIRSSKRRQYLGITADSLNASLKSSFAATGQWRFEAAVRDGVIFDNEDLGARVEGFDIARCDEQANLARLWSLCFGRRRLHQGESLWNRSITGRPSYESLAETVAKQGVPGIDLDIVRDTPTILGEIQFGNWALAYRDIMKLLAARTEIDVDLFLYVVADGRLAEMISAGTVNYGKFVGILGEFQAVTTVPTWVVGVDFEPADVPTLEGLTQPGSA